jgi:uncharacterized protein YjiS (DUF1127 family)
MTTASAVITRPIDGSVAASWTRRVRRALGEYRAYRTTLVELQGLSEDQLRDVGMSRDALPRIARAAARQI